MGHYVNRIEPVEGSGNENKFRVTWVCDYGGLQCFNLRWYEYYNNSWHLSPMSSGTGSSSGNVGPNDDPTSPGDNVPALEGVPYEHIHNLENTNATKLKVEFRPVAKEAYRDGDKIIRGWTASSCTAEYDLSDSLPNQLSSCSIEFRDDNDRTKAWVSAKGITDTMHITDVQFQVIKDNINNIIYDQRVPWDGVSKAEREITLEPNHTYYVRCRGWNKNGSSGAWGDTWSEGLRTPPNAVQNFKIKSDYIQQTSQVVIEFTWDAIANVDKYSIEYISEYGNWNNDNDIQTISDNITRNSYRFNVGTGGSYIFRIAAWRDGGHSVYTEQSFSFGVKPSQPTVWTDQTYYSSDDSYIAIYWKHNSQDSTREIKAQVGVKIGDNEEVIHEINRANWDSKDWYKNNHYLVDVSEQVTSVDISYRVRTAGVSGEYSDWSEMKTIKLYRKPGILMYVYNGEGINPFVTSSDQITSLPFSYNCYCYEYRKPIERVRYTYSNHKPNTTTGMPVSSQGDNRYWVATQNGSTLLPADDIQKIKISGSIPTGVAIRIITFDSMGNRRKDTDWMDNEDWKDNNSLFYIDDSQDKFFCLYLMLSGAALGWTNSMINNSILWEYENHYYISQNIVEYSIQIEANTEYKTFNKLGQEITIHIGDILFKKRYSGDDFEAMGGSIVHETIDCNDCSEFYPGKQYKIKISAAFESGMTAENESTFLYSPTGTWKTPNATVTINDHVAYIKVTGPTLPTGDSYNNYINFVYRRNIDGTLTCVASNINPSATGTTVVDPHPIIGHNAYLVGCMNKKNALVGRKVIEVEHTSCLPIVEFASNWTPYMFNNPDAWQYFKDITIDQIFNVTLSENNSKESESIQFAGRSSKITYFGTSVEEKQSWSFAFPREDKETLYKLRLLSVYEGNAYIREPNGRGYWANVDVSINDKYDDPTTTGTLTITKAGGVTDP